MRTFAIIGWIGLAAWCPGGARAAENGAMNVMAAAGAGAVTGFASAAEWDFPRVLPAPPRDGSPEAEADLTAVRQAQAWRTEEQVAWAKLVERDQVFNYANVIGAWFTKERLPRLAELFARVGTDMRAIDRAAKLPFQRPRPTEVDASVVPCVTVPTSTSYPSGSAMQAWVWGELLAEIFPYRREEILERAERAAWGARDRRGAFPERSGGRETARGGVSRRGVEESRVSGRGGGGAERTDARGGRECAVTATVGRLAGARGYGDVGGGWQA
jgi:hypothetical protein